MKLWQKTSLICIAVLLVIVTACSAVLLIHSKNSILELTYSRARDRQKSLASSFSEMAGYYIAEGDSLTVETSLVNYCFSRFADSSSVLMRGDETLYSGVSVNPRAFLPLPENEYSMKIAEREIDGRNVLIVGSLVMVRSASHAVYVVEGYFHNLQQHCKLSVDICCRQPRGRTYRRGLYCAHHAPQHKAAHLPCKNGAADRGRRLFHAGRCAYGRRNRRACGGF